MTDIMTPLEQCAVGPCESREAQWTFPGPEGHFVAVQGAVAELGRGFAAY